VVAAPSEVAGSVGGDVGSGVPSEVVGSSDKRSVVLGADDVIGSVGGDVGSGDPVDVGSCDTGSVLSGPLVDGGSLGGNVSFDDPADVGPSVEVIGSVFTVLTGVSDDFGSEDNGSVVFGPSVEAGSVGGDDISFGLVSVESSDVVGSFDIGSVLP